MEDMMYEEPGTGDPTPAKWRWELEANAKYTTRSLRKAIDDITLHSKNLHQWWLNIVPIKTNIFIWRVIQNRLPTRANLYKRGVSIPSQLCALCNRAEETGNHLFLECSTAVEVQAHLHNWWGANGMPRRITEVSDMFSEESRTKSTKIEVARRAYLSILWKYRNEAIFTGKVQRNNQLVAEVKMTAFSWYTNRNKKDLNCNWDIWSKTIL